MNDSLIEFVHLKQHPKDCPLFSIWLESNDKFRKNSGSYKIHRTLTVKEGANNPIPDLADMIKEHHILPERLDYLKKKKSILNKYDFSEFVKSQNLLPTEQKTQRGNLGEIILGEYLERVTDNEVIINRLRYNPNVEQSMKGDDILLLNKDNPFLKVYTGESKFRTTPSQSAVEELTKEYGKQITRPLSIGFTTNLLYTMGRFEEAEILEELSSKIAKDEIDIVNIGLLISNHNAANHIESHLVSSNPNFAVISMNIRNPDAFADLCFQTAFRLLEGDEDEE